jgi:UDP-N-acetylglucosamine--N-acetylmuramyl-(pentapeptide) pyrophosphoryl-undecaprenol N-acetylglucosamine transferase
MAAHSPAPLIAIACGGTGGHLFPGLAVADVLRNHGCEVSLLVSSKEVDQDGVKSVTDMEILTLPAVALQNRQVASFSRQAWKSFGICRQAFRQRPPRAVLAMGGFTSAPPVMAGRAMGAATFVHEANSIPGRANRWLALMVDEAFVGFPCAAARLTNATVTVTGTPVRPQFKPVDPAPCRMALGLRSEGPVLLVMGGSQGASAINELVCRAVPALARRIPDLQILHITGQADRAKVQASYAAQNQKALVMPFLTEMDLALGAATLGVSRAGASSLAEFAAMRLPSILIPYPTAADNHQFYNAQAFFDTGAAWQISQADLTPELLARAAAEWILDREGHGRMQRALEQWHFPNAAREIAAAILRRIRYTAPHNPQGFSFEDEEPAWPIGPAPHSSKLTGPLRS